MAQLILMPFEVAAYDGGCCLSGLPPGGYVALDEGRAVEVYQCKGLDPTSFSIGQRGRKPRPQVYSGEAVELAGTKRRLGGFQQGEELSEVIFLYPWLENW